MRTRKYFNDKLFRDYLPDRTIFTFKSAPINCTLNFVPIQGLGITIPVSNGRFFLKPINDKYMITGSVRFSGCRLAREYLKVLYPDCSRLDEKHNNDNYLPTEARAMLKRKGIPISKIRNAVLSEIAKIVNTTLSELVLFSKSHLVNPLCWAEHPRVYASFDKEFMRVYLKEQEVAFDVLGPRTLSVATQPAVIESFNSYAEKTVDGYYKRNGFRAFRSSVERHQNAFQYPAIKMYISKIDAQKSGPFIIYKKAVGDGGSITRFEGTSDERSIQSICGDKLMKSKEDYAKALRKIARVHFFHFKEALANTKIKEPSIEKKIKHAILTIFKSRGVEMYSMLKKNGYRISTSSESMFSSKSKVSALAKNNVVFKKIGSSLFKVDTELVSNWEERYAALKAREKEARKIKRQDQ